MLICFDFKRFALFLALFLCVFSVKSICASSYKQMLQDVYSKNRPGIKGALGQSYFSLCKINNLNPDDSVIERNILFPMFVHKLLTTSSAFDCASGGVLKTVYFWHWKTPNPRHSIIHLPDSIRLTGVRPPSGFSKYKSFADIDRFPIQYLSDLVTENASYLHPDCGAFYTFGWCSEREMSFGVLLGLYDFKYKIKQSGIHVWTDVLASVSQNSGVEINLILSFDNTFDSFKWDLLRISEDRWRKDIGVGSQIVTYNRIAKSKAQMNGVESILISGSVVDRIDRSVVEWAKSSN